MMPKFVIEREFAGAGKWPKQELQAISQKACGVLQNMGPEIQWLQSFVTDDKIYCVYIAPDEATVRAHAQLGGFPADPRKRIIHEWAIRVDRGKLWAEANEPRGAVFQFSLPTDNDS
jgi:uncharacterized protein DUF4242